MTAKTLYDKLWDEHVIKSQPDGTTLLYIDRHLVHEVTSPQAFEGLAEMHRKPWRMTSVVATTDHNTPTTGWDKGLDGIEDPISKLQVTTLIDNLKKNPPAAFFPFLSRRQGIIHVIGPEEGATLPGMTIVCGDSHTSTHGALGTLAMGIGTSEVEHVLATQSLLTKKNKNMLVRVEGKLQPGITGKDIALAFIGRVGTAGGTGCTIEFAGSAIRGLSMEGRMTLCNMAIEAGARSGLVAVDEKTLEYIKNRPLAPEGELWDKAVAYWNTLHSDEGGHFDIVVDMKAEEIEPMVTWGTSPEMVAPITGVVPDPKDMPDPVRREGWERALAYIGLEPEAGRKKFTRYPMKPTQQTAPVSACLAALPMPLTSCPLTVLATAALSPSWCTRSKPRFTFWRRNLLPEPISSRCGQKLWRFTEAAGSSWLSAPPCSGISKNTSGILCLRTPKPE